MGFTLKKKNKTEGLDQSGEQGSGKNSKLNQISEVFGDRKKSEPLIYIAIACLLSVVFFLAYLVYNVPRNNDLTRSLGELRLLSVTLPDQAAVATSGSPDAMTALLAAQKDFDKNLAMVKDIAGVTADVTAVEKQWNMMSKDIDTIAAKAKVLKNPAELVVARNAAAQVQKQSADLLNVLKKNKIEETMLNLIPVALLAMFMLLAGFVWSMYRLLSLRGDADKERVARLQEEYDRNQNAILRLLDEIADLADGDLRSYATVSEDFTGAIADSINFAIDQLRDLVSRINETSQEVARYTQDTQNITNQLAEASEHQAQEIAGASAAINEMAYSIDQVSSNATESAEVAQRSVQIASNGADVVNRSIEGMDTIREQIQETSKRIKRLGESSQEIGNIVSLINDIADQTNILALNAAIQASMAGEYGRGFAVVADEVQRLAERSASATKQIETLVKTIQADTNEAVISMEQTTSEVVRGANLAKDAGVALDEIQKVSGDLAKLIASISDAAQLQSASAGHIANTMHVVQEITSQTTGATFDTARSVSELAHMAESLRESVTDFKLPE